MGSRFFSRAALLALLPILVASWLPAAQPPVRAQTLVGATLSILAPLVEVSLAGAPFGAAQDGQTLRPGDQVRTGATGIALLTFFDGTETQLTSETQVE